MYIFTYFYLASLVFKKIFNWIFAYSHISDLLENCHVCMVPATMYNALTHLYDKKFTCWYDWKLHFQPPQKSINIYSSSSLEKKKCLTNSFVITIAWCIIHSNEITLDPSREECAKHPYVNRYPPPSVHPNPARANGPLLLSSCTRSAIHVPYIFMSVGCT